MNPLRVAAPALLVLSLAACGPTAATGSSHASASASASTSGHKAAKKPKGVYDFGDTVTFSDGSTLTVGKPKSFTPGQYASAMDGTGKQHVKFKITFANGSKKVFDPTLTSTTISSEDAEGGEVFDGDSLGGSPQSKVLPGHTLSWTEGYKVKSAKKVTLTVSIGFLDYADATFTNES